MDATFVYGIAVVDVDFHLSLLLWKIRSSSHKTFYCHILHNKLKRILFWDLE